MIMYNKDNRDVEQSCYGCFLSVSSRAKSVVFLLSSVLLCDAKKLLLRNCAIDTVYMLSYMLSSTPFF